MKNPIVFPAMVAATLALSTGMAHAGKYQDATQLFKDAAQSASFFDKSYAYAIFPTVGQGGFLVGGAYGNGRVYQHGNHVGDTSVTQLSVGWQAGGQAYSEIVFFEDKRALDEFESGAFQFGAGVGVVVITAGAAADVATSGAGAGASGGPKNAVLVGKYEKGMAVFTIVKGGLMFDASVEGEKFSYRSHKHA
jgi:lipid-binding SYLF domain-containing protein